MLKDRALSLQYDREFQTTQLLHFLAYGKFEEAKEFASKMTVDLETAKGLLSDYEQLYLK